MNFPRFIAISFALLLAAPMTIAASEHTKGRAVKDLTAAFKPGDYAGIPKFRLPVR